MSAGKGQGKGSFIVMEYLDFGGSYSQADLGQRLAEMHKAEPAVSMLTRHCSFVSMHYPFLLCSCLSNVQIQQGPGNTPGIPDTFICYT